MSSERGIIEKLYEGRKYSRLLENLPPEFKKLIHKYDARSIISKLLTLGIDINSTNYEVTRLSNNRDARFNDPNVVLFFVLDTGWGKEDLIVMYKGQIINDSSIMLKGGGYVHQLSRTGILDITKKIYQLKVPVGSAEALKNKRKERQEQKSGMIQRYGKSAQDTYYRKVSMMGRFDKSGYKIDPDKYKKLAAEMKLNDLVPVMQKAQRYIEQLVKDYAEISSIRYKDEESDEKFYRIQDDYDTVIREILKYIDDVNRYNAEYKKALTNRREGSEWWINNQKEYLIHAIKDISDSLRKADKLFRDYEKVKRSLGESKKINEDFPKSLYKADKRFRNNIRNIISKEVGIDIENTPVKSVAISGVRDSQLSDPNSVLILTLKSTGDIKLFKDTATVAVCGGKFYSTDYCYDLNEYPSKQYKSLVDLPRKYIIPAIISAEKLTKQDGSDLLDKRKGREQARKGSIYFDKYKYDPTVRSGKYAPYRQFDRSGFKVDKYKYINMLAELKLKNLDAVIKEATDLYNELAKYMVLGSKLKYKEHGVDSDEYRQVTDGIFKNLSDIFRYGEEWEKEKKEYGEEYSNDTRQSWYKKEILDAITDIRRYLNRGKKLLDILRKLSIQNESIEYDDPTDYDEEYDEYDEVNIEEAVSLKPFTKTDYYGYAGAEKFSDGSDPFIATEKLTSKLEVTVLVDATGLSADIYDDDLGEQYFSLYKKASKSQLKSEGDRILRLLSRFDTLDDVTKALKNQGFRRTI